MGFKNSLYYCLFCIFCFSCTSDEKASDDTTTNTASTTTTEEVPELDAYFQTKLTNVSSGVEENFLRLDGLENRINELVEKSKSPTHTSLLNDLELEWSDIFNDNEEIKLLADEAKSTRNQEVLAKIPERLKDVDLQIETLDNVLFRIEPSIRKGKDINIEEVRQKINLTQESVAATETVVSKPTVPEPTNNTASNQTASQPEYTTSKPTVPPPAAAQPAKERPKPIKVEKAPEPSTPIVNTQPVEDYDASLGDIVLEDCKRLKRKLDNVVKSGKKLTTGSNSEYASVFSQDKKEMDNAISSAQNGISEIERLVAAANSEKNLDKVFVAKQKTGKIGSKISAAENIIESLARKVDSENTKKAAAAKAAADKAAANKAAADKAAAAAAAAKAATDKAAADKAAAAKAAAAKAAADKAAADKAAAAAAADKEAADKAAAAKAAADKAAAEAAANNAVAMGATEHSTEVKNTVANETIQQLMKLSPNNRGRSISESIEAQFADPSSQSITVIDEYSNSKKYSIKDYIRKMIISGPYFIQVDKIDLNQNKKIVGIVITDTKVQ